MSSHVAESPKPPRLVGCQRTAPGQFASSLGLGGLDSDQGDLAFGDHQELARNKEQKSSKPAAQEVQSLIDEAYRSIYKSHGFIILGSMGNMFFMVPLLVTSSKKLVGRRPSLLGWRPLLLGWRQSLLVARS